MGFRRRQNRATGVIDRLPPETKDTVDQMLIGGRPYREIVEYLAEHEIAISQQSVCRYARRFLVSVEQLRIGQENMRMLMQEMEQYPELDTTEAILRVATNNVFSAITAVPAESWEGIDPTKLLKEAGALIRAAGYKRKVDHDLQTDTEAALAANQSLLYEVISRQHPELYTQLTEVLSAAKSAAREEAI